MQTNKEISNNNPILSIQPKHYVSIGGIINYVFPNNLHISFGAGYCYHQYEFIKYNLNTKILKLLDQLPNISTDNKVKINKGGLYFKIGFGVTKNNVAFKLWCRISTSFKILHDKDEYIKNYSYLFGLSMSIDKQINKYMCINLSPSIGLKMHNTSSQINLY